MRNEFYIIFGTRPCNVGNPKTIFFNEPYAAPILLRKPRKREKRLITDFIDTVSIKACTHLPQIRIFLKRNMAIIFRCQLYNN